MPINYAIVENEKGDFFCGKIYKENWYTIKLQYNGCYGILYHKLNDTTHEGHFTNLYGKLEGKGLAQFGYYIYLR